MLRRLFGERLQEGNQGFLVVNSQSHAAAICAGDMLVLTACSINFN